MAKKKPPTQDMERITAGLAASFSGLEKPGGHGYELSSAFALAEKRRFLGTWEVAEHFVGEFEYPQHFINTILHGAELQNPAYLATYRFFDGVCVRRSIVSGSLVLPDARPNYRFRMSMTLQWALEPQTLLIRPLMAYQYASLDDEPAAVKEMPDSGEWQRINYRMEGTDLVLTDDSDIKRLRRNPT